MSVLATAQKLVGDGEGARPAAYGHPSDNHGCTAALMLRYLERRYGVASFDALDVCAFNMLQKLSRLANSPNHLDSLVDICGYARNWEMILERPPGTPAE